MFSKPLYVEYILFKMCIGQGFAFFCKLQKYFLTFMGLENSRWSYLCSYQPVKYKQPLTHVQRNDHKWIQKHFVTDSHVNSLIFGRNTWKLS